MQKLIFLTCIFLIPFTSFCQKKNSTPQLEIDRLYNKYKSDESTIIYFPGGSVLGTISITMNEDEKPKEILIEGKSKDVKEISKFISYYIKQKISKGFKEDGEVTMSGGWSADLIESSLDNFDNEVRFDLIKGNEYTVIYCNKDKVKNQFVEFGSDEYFESKSKTIYYNFRLTTGDMRRIGGTNSKPFDF